MAQSRDIMLMAGDGSNAQTVSHIIRLIEWFNETRYLDITIHEGLIGTAAQDTYGQILHPKTIEACFQSDAIIIDALHKNSKPAVGELIEEMKFDYTLSTIHPYQELSDINLFKEKTLKNLSFLVMTYLQETHSVRTVENGDTKKSFVCSQDLDTDAFEKFVQTAQSFAEKRGRKLCLALPPLGEAFHNFTQTIIEGFSDHVTVQKMTPTGLIRSAFKTPQAYDTIITLPRDFHTTVASLSQVMPDSLEYDCYLKMPGERLTKQYLYHIHPAISQTEDDANPYTLYLMLAQSLRNAFNKPVEADFIEKAVHSLLSRGMRPAVLSNDEGQPTSLDDINHHMLEEIKRSFALNKSA